MKILIAGSRIGFPDEQKIHSILDYVRERSNKPFEFVVHGGARGVDTYADNWAKLRNIETIPFPVSNAEWKEYGKRAGILRNKEMALVADGLIAFCANNSKGTWHMISEMRKYRKPCVVYDENLKRLA